MNGNRIIQFVFYFFLLVLVEVFVVNKLQLNIYLVPHVYVFFVLLLPSKMQKIYVLLLSFLLGVIIDLFLHTNGVHTAAATFIGLLRNFLLPYVISIDQQDNDVVPSIRTMSWKKNIAYVSILVFVHQILLHSLSYFKLSAILIVFAKALASTILSVLLILILQLILFNRQKK